jgi:hypothetical protein
VSDEEIRKLLQAALHSKDSPLLTESVVEALSSEAAEVPSGTVARAEARFVIKVLSKFYPEFVRQAEKLPFGRWIGKVMENARLSRGMIATALGKDEAFIKLLETGDILPWELEPGEAADIISLFRIHIDAVIQLLAVSLAVSRTRARGEKMAAARAHKGRPSRERSESTKLAWDLYLAHKAPDTELSREILQWLVKVRDELRNRQAGHLLE